MPLADVAYEYHYRNLPAAGSTRSRSVMVVGDDEDDNRDDYDRLARGRAS